MKPNWCSIRDDQPSRSGHYLCWDEHEQNMWIGAFNDSGGQNTWGEARPLGWLPGSVPTHWAERPIPPTAR